MGISYPYDQCEYIDTQQGHLMSQKQAKHEDIKYFCDQCILLRHLQVT